MSEQNGDDFKHNLDKIVNISSAVALNNGSFQTIISYLSVLRENKPMPVARGILSPSFCLVVQGNKRLQVGNETIDYGQGEYLASGIDMPIQGQVLTATPKKPYIAIRIELTLAEIASVALDANIKFKTNHQLRAGAFVGKANNDILEVFIRLLKLSKIPKDAEFLASSVKREIIYRILSGRDGELFYRNMMIHHEVAGISDIINWIKTHFDLTITVGELAEIGNMSVSSLHQKFKTVTTMGPLQYQKQLRLQEARRLLITGTHDVTRAALQVGYKSLTQFNREYKRFYGLPPLKDVQFIQRLDESGHIL